MGHNRFLCPVVLASRRYSNRYRRLPCVPILTCNKEGVFLNGEILTFITDMLIDIYGIALPWGISFGAVIVGVATMPLLVQIIKKIF